MSSAPNPPLRHPGAAPLCPDCAGVGVRLKRGNPHAEAVVCECVGVCPVCDDQEWIAQGDSFRAPRVRCACARIKARRKHLTEARIPSRYANATLANFDHTKTGMAAFFALNTYLKEFSRTEENRGVVLHGDVGRGKTHLIVAVLRELVLRYGVTARFIEFSHLLTDLKKSFERREGAASLMDDLTKVQVLAIDELGKGRATAFEGTVVDELVTRRYNAAAPILCTTNYPPKAATGHSTPNLAVLSIGQDDNPTLVDRVGERVFSRLREVCDFVPVDGEDMRRIRPTGGRSRR